MSSTTRTCEFCGAQLEPVIIDNPLGTLGFGTRAKHDPNRRLVVGYQTCRCEQAQARLAATMREEEQEAARRAQRAVDAKLSKAGIKPRYRAATHPEEGLWEAARDGIGLYICGRVGTGKTHLASAVARRLVLDGKMTVRMMTTVDVMDAFKATFGGSGSEREVAARLGKVDVLVLDDLGKEPPTDWTLSRLFQIVNSRYEAMRPIVVTTQFSRSALIKRLAKNGDEETAIAIVSRLCETSRTVVLDGADRRVNHGR